MVEKKDSLKVAKLEALKVLLKAVRMEVCLAEMKVVEKVELKVSMTVERKDLKSVE